MKTKPLCEESKSYSSKTFFISGENRKHIHTLMNGRRKRPNWMDRALIVDKKTQSQGKFAAEC